MAEDFYSFVDSGDPAPDNSHLNGAEGAVEDTDKSSAETAGGAVRFATRISVYDDMLSTPRVIVIEQGDVRTYLEEITNTVYRVMKEQGGRLSLMVIRELVENFIHAHFTEPVISILDGGDTIRFADQGPGIADKERAFEFGVTSADREQKRYIRGTGAGLPMVQQYLENAGGAVSIEDNLNQGTVVTVSVDPDRVAEITRTVSRGAAVRAAEPAMNTTAPQAPMNAPVNAMMNGAGYQAPTSMGYPYPAVGMNQPAGYPFNPAMMPSYQQYGHQFSTIPQPMGSPAGFYQPAPTGMAVPTMPRPQPYISERGTVALHFIAQQGMGGPTDLANACGESAATWSRELGKLANTGLVAKHGKKYLLTEMGKALVQQG